MKEQFGTDFFLQQASFKNWVLGENEADCAYWDTWIAEHPESAPMAFFASKLLAGLPVLASDVTDENIRIEWNKLYNRIQEAEPKRSTSKVVQFLLRAAAVVAFAIISGTLAVYYLFSPVIVEYATEGNSQKKVVLSDGTEIALNNKSSIIVQSSSRFAVPREVWLKGEAYFHVQPMTEESTLKPFIVHTPDLDVKVLGTQFNVNARDSKTKVLLDEGKVVLKIMQQVVADSITMTPGDFVSYASLENKVNTTKTPINSTYVTAWKTGFFQFNKTPVSEVIALAESVLDVKVVLSKPAILKQTITGKIPSKNPDDIFNSISSLFNLTYHKEGSTIYLNELKSDTPSSKKN
jgi:ferric-dicitrate binding protein FerR (iron transport regulator)